jgi:chromosome segregation protein
MFLTKIEINGFKSFAQKTVLDFSESGTEKPPKDSRKLKPLTPFTQGVEKGITAIVGPNGSGKSNVADALKWVMGEQSMKSLRGKKSSDIIFAGSSSKSRLGSAQVSIFLDNSDKSIPIDYEEVVIARKIYQSGESEYLINGSKVRLGDVLELLAKAGVGQRSYSIVDQGMADRLLNATPMERRIIIEEAAGVREYQMKKEKSQRKLKSTTKNLQRAKELLVEIEPHLRLLKRQYNKAQKGEVYIEELRAKQNELYKFLWSELTISKTKFLGQQEVSEKKVNIFQKEINDLSDNIKKESENSVSYKEEISQLEQEKRGVSEELNNLERKLVIDEGRVELERERLQRIQEIESVPVNTNLIKKELEKIKNKQEEFIEKVTGIKDVKDVATLKKYAQKIARELQSLYEAVIKGRVEKKKPSAEIAKQKKENDDKIARLNKFIKEKQIRRDKFSKQVSVLNDKIDALVKKDNDERRASIEMEDQLRKKRFEIDKLKNELNSYQIELAKLEVKEEDLRGQIKIEMKMNPEKLMTEQNLALRAKQGERKAEPLVKSEIKEIDVSEYTSRIYWLKMQMEQIGGIDEEVIDEYKETQQRYDFLVKESEDLREAMKKLEKVIIEMDEQIKGKFAEAFRVINKEFGHYFKIIFNGGSARLEKVDIEMRGKKQIDAEGNSIKKGSVDDLSEDEEDDEEEKETQIGVEVVVNPPGKKIANVGMLSGGERTLTSLALLFAIISHNPPPFALLDEVEAALDEANSRRFGKILSELADQTQFILITHNRQVMKEAMVIYGVTMRGDGVSELLSIKLEGAEKYAE